MESSISPGSTPAGTAAGGAGVEPLYRHAHLTEAVARLIYEAFWKDRDGMTMADLVAHLGNARDPNRIPLSLIALVDGELAGTVNLIDNDDRKRAHLHPWLAAMVVVDKLRGKGIGTRLVQALLAEAARIGFANVYFGTDGPGFYARLGAKLHEQVTPEFCIMRFSRPGEDAGEARSVAGELFAGRGYRALEISAGEVAALQSFFTANPEYFLQIGGEVPAADEGRKVFGERPPEGWSWDRRWLIGFVDGNGAWVAVAEVVTNLLVEGVSHIGLFIVATSLHGSGAAREIYAGLEAWIRRGGARWLRLGVVEGNSRAERFWERAGYLEVRKRSGMEFGRRSHTVRVLVKALANGRMPEYLGMVARDRPEAP